MLIDHLVYAVPDLRAAVADVEERLGVRALDGGRHTGLGTHNALLALASATYLEIIAADPGQPRPSAPHPLGIDGISHSGLAGWALACDDIDATVAGARRDGYDAGQQALHAQLSERELTGAARLQVLLGDLADKARQAWPFEPMIANLAGYDRKNAYMVKHWDAIQAGRAPDDPLLVQAERRFFDTLAIETPADPSALNGLGTILMFRRDLDAAEFFIQAAIAEAERLEMDYPDATHDLSLVRRFKSP